MRQCELCAKGSRMQGKRHLLRAHYNPVNWSRKYPNLQWAHLPAGKAGVKSERKKICTNCLKNLHKTANAK